MGVRDGIAAADGAPAPVRLGGLLVAAGALAPEVLRAALSRQRGTGARLGDVLRAHSLVGADALAVAVARQHDLPLADLAALPPDPDLLPDARITALHARRALPWRRDPDGGMVFATPEPGKASADLDGLARAFAVPGGVPIRLAVCGAEAFETAVQRLAPKARAARAARRTPRRLSARGLMAPAGRAGFIGAAAAAAALIASAPATAAALLFLAALVFNAINIGLRVAVMLTPPRAAPAAAPPPRLIRAAEAEAAADGEPRPELLPMVSILIALYREPQVAAGLIRALERLDWPPERLEVLLALEHDDPDTAAAIAAAAPPPWLRVIVTPPGGPRTKPRALNHALDFARGALIGVYDAEDRPHPQQIRRAAEAFARSSGRLGCVQARLSFYNEADGWIPRMFAVEYATWFHLMLPGMMRLGFPIPLGGTSLFLRRQVLERLGGWDAHNVTEDADLGIRLARAGYVTAMIDSETREESVRRPLAWIRQRSRWQKGYLFTWLTHMRDPLQLWRDLGPRGFLGFQALFLGAAAAFLSLPLLWSAWLWWGLLQGAWADLGLRGPATALLFWVLAAGQVVVIGSSLLALRRAGRRDLARWALTLPFYAPLGTLSALKAMAEAVAAPAWWDKTRHGRTRTGPGARGATWFKLRRDVAKSETIRRMRPGGFPITTT